MRRGPLATHDTSACSEPGPDRASHASRPASDPLYLEIRLETLLVLRAIRVRRALIQAVSSTRACPAATDTRRTRGV